MSDLQNLADQQEIYALSCRYMRGLDRLDRSLLHSVFSADAYCEYGFINGTPEVFIDYAINALQGHIANHHMIGNHLIEFEGEEAFGEIYFNAYHKVPDAAGPAGHCDRRPLPGSLRQNRWRVENGLQK